MPSCKKTATRTKPKLWSRIKSTVTSGTKGGKAGQWSARKAQIATAKYKSAGGGYSGKKCSNNSLSKWTREDWGYTGKKKKSRYLPKAARRALSPGEKAATSRAKNRGKGQYVKQPKKIAEKTKRYR